MRFIKSLISNFKFLIPVALVFLLIPILTHAQASLGLPSSLAGLSSQDVKVTIQNIVQIIFGFLGILLVLFLLYGGWLWMTSQGNEDQIDRAKKVITSAVIGLVITLAAFSIASFIVTSVQQATGPGNGGNGGGGGGGGGPCPTCPTNCTNPGAGGPIKVCALSPGTAGRGSTVTVIGYNFGAYDPANSKVIVQSATPATAAFASCQGTVQWTDNQIKFKVPSGINPGNFLIEVKKAGASCTNAGGLCQTLAVNNSTQPSIDCVSPTSGPAGTTVTIQGSNFGASSDTVEMQGATGRFSVGGSNITSWQPDTIKVTVPVATPQAAISGDIKVAVGSQQSNGQFFGVSCSANSQCATNCCSGSVCREASVCAGGGTPTGAPTITSISPNNGEVGSFVTIQGSNFGATADKVHVQVGATDYTITTPPAAACSTTWWSDKQIIFAIPATIGVSTNGASAVTVETAQGESGSVNFDLNDTVRPGVCSLNPTTGQFKDSVTIIGTNFTGATRTVQFGSIDGDSVNFSSATQATAKVPNIQPATVGVTVKVGSESSNPLAFVVGSTASGQARIDYIDPTAGPAGQYVQIYGSNFGNSAGVVRFIKGPDTFIGDTGFPTACSANFWHSDHIVVKVPADATATLGQYQVQIHPASGADSNLVDFTKNSSSLTPGICALNPVKGPVGTSVTISGDAFGSSGQAIFSNNKPAVSSSAANQQIIAPVPVGAQTGLVKVRSGTVDSAGVAFEVGSCNNNSQCPSGSQCCTDGACRSNCSATSGPQCKYRWSFTTGQNPFTLDIAAQCSSEGQSPSPYPYQQFGGYDANDAAKNAPVDAVIAARFTADLDFSSVAANVRVLGCNTGATLNEPTCVNPVVGTFKQWAGSRGFMFEPDTILGDQTWYKVELNANGGFVLARDGSKLQPDPQLGTDWFFRTRSSAQATCQPTTISVTPASQTIFLQNSAQYSAAALDASSCTFCRSSSLTWNWSATNASLVTLNTNNNQVTATADTNQVGTTGIQATLVNSPIAPGQAQLEVKSGEPFVTNFSPTSSCTSACTNAIITASFSMPMDQLTVESGSGIELQRCTDANCTSFSNSITVNAVYDGATRQTLITPSSNLTPDSWYRVIIHNSLKNSYGALLTHLNYPIGTPDSFSWKFKTGTSSCTPDAISLSPDTASAVISQTVNYRSRVIVNSGNSCGAVNLNADSYKWRWQSTDTSVATVSNGITPTAIATAVNIGTTQIKVSLVDYPAIASASGTLNVTATGPTGNHPALSLTGHTPSGSPVCRNAEVSAQFTNKLSSFSVLPFAINCGSSTCPAGGAFIRNNQVVYAFKNKDDLWPANTTITIQLQTGVKDIYGQTWLASGAGNERWSFTTTDSLCKIGYVTVVPHPYTFTQANVTNIFNAVAYGSDGTPITGVNYDWPANSSSAIMSVPASATQSNVVTSKNKNGSDYVYVNTSGTLAGQNLGTATGHARVNVNLCENPWTLSPYVDGQYDFSFSYCKDSLSPGSNDLPNLPSPVIRTPNSSGSGDVLKEHVFVVDPTKAGGTVTGGANQDPTFDAEPSAVTSSAGEFIHLQLTAKDPEGDQYVMVADPNSLPSGASFNSYNGVFIWVPQTAGSFSPTFYLRNNGATNVATKTIAITVNASSNNQTVPKVTMAQPFNGNTIYANLGETKSFTAGIFPVPSVTVESFVWDFQDGGQTSNYVNGGNTFSVDHTFTQTGVKQVTFRAKAVNGGWSQPAVVTVIVRQATSWVTPLQHFISTNVLSRLAVRWFDTAWAQTAGQSYDVIVVRVMKNIEHLSPLEWYRKYAPNPSGSPASLKVNGYPAIQDGTTTYVAAANIPGGNVSGAPVYTNIYLISYNASAKATTKKIVQQILNSWSFNDSFIDGDDFNGQPAHCHVAITQLCNADDDCGAGDYCLSQKATIRRDVARYTDINSIGRKLNEYATAHRFCQNNPATPCVTNTQCGNGGVCLSFYPKLASGSYVAGMSTSKWPSWEQSFASTIGGTQPVDPVNKYDSCADNKFDPYDKETCWDATARKFSCPSDASVYIYQVQQDTSYRLSANLETNSRFSWAKENQNLAFSNAAVCTGTPQAGICGNSVLETGEVCDGGFTNACPSDSNNQRTVGCKSDCSGWLPLPAGWSCGGSCGNGSLDTPFEQCDLTSTGYVPTDWSCSLGGVASCGNQCRFSCTAGQPYQGKCGDDVTQLPEVCDDGAANGSYGKCNTTCSGYGEFCGDGVVSGSEECDTSQGLSGHSCPAGQSLYCDSNCKRSCSNLTPASVTPGVCGNNLVESSNGEQCEPDLYQSPAPEQSSVDRQYVCADTSAGALACKITGGYCGDSQVQTPFENCDEGRAKNGVVCDQTTSTCTYCTTSCQLKVLVPNRCGDGIKAGIEYCDEGRNNGLPGKCNATCTAIGSGSSGPSCGDGVPEPPEYCDEGPLNGQVGHCNGTCSGVIIPNNCGNNVIDVPETCDDDGANGQPLHCNLMCNGNTPASCGNGIKEAAPYGNEECDNGGLNGTSGNACDASCKNVTTTPPPNGTKTCGDGQVQAPNDAGINEICDSGNANGSATKCWTDCLRYTKYCGDTLKQTPNDAGQNEFCDDGPANGSAVNKCNTACTALVTEICGDRQITGGEQCDICASGNGYCNASGQSVANCDITSCRLQQAGIACGNSIKEGTEACDYGCPNTNQHVCFSSAADAIAGNGWCRDNCATNCGDGFWSAAFANPGDVCDLGYGQNGQTIGQCNATCTGNVKYNCGDGVVTNGTAEICDDGAAHNGQSGYCGPGPTQPIEKYGVEDGCTSCANVNCGDGIVSSSCNTAQPSFGKEACDPGNPATPNCNKWCTGACGNKIVDPGETCDDPNGQNGQAGKCNLTCDGITASVCGDGIKNGSEMCDGSDFGNYTCQIYGYEDGNLSCRSDCTINNTACYKCGDGVVNGSEQCDGANLNGKSCSAVVTGSTGTLSCYPASAPTGQRCTFNTAQCSVPVAQVCGDGAVTGTETCDYGATGVVYKSFTCTTNAVGLATAGIRSNSCSSCTSETIGQCVPNGLSLQTDTADVSYYNGRLLLYPQCTLDVPDPQGITYPDAAVTYPGTGNACASNNIPATSGGAVSAVNSVRGTDQFIAWENRNSQNIVAVKFVKPTSMSFAKAAASFASPANKLVYYLSNSQTVYDSNRWVCSASAPDKNGNKWYDLGYDDAGWTSPRQSGTGTPSCQNNNVCAGLGGWLGACPATNMFMWGPNGCVDSVVYCRLKYWAN